MNDLGSLSDRGGEPSRGQGGTPTVGGWVTTV